MSFSEEITKVKEGLKGLITKETPQGDITKIAEIDKFLDNANAEYETAKKQYSELKDAYIDVVKNTSFASKDGDPLAKDKGAEDKPTKTFAEYLKEAQKDAK